MVFVLWVILSCVNASYRQMEFSSSIFMSLLVPPVEKVMSTDYLHSNVFIKVATI